MHLSETAHGWRVIVQHGGQRRSATAPTKMEARRRGAALILELGGSVDVTDLTVGELVADYLNDLETRASPKYLDEAVRAADRLPDAFLQRRASKVTGMHLDALYRQLAPSLSTSAVRRIHTVVLAAYGRAVKLGVLSTSPRVGKPQADTPDVQPPSHEQARAVLAATTGLEHLALRLAAVTGCRRGEIVALQWDDLNLERAQLHVRRSLVAVRGRVVPRATKTGRKGHRTIGLDLPTVQLLRKHRAVQLERCLENRLTPTWIISDDGQDPWRPDRLTHVFIEARRRAGIEGIRLHSLRHYVATNMLADGEPLAKVAQRLGHRSQTTTATTYSHWLDNDDSEAAERLAARLS